MGKENKILKYRKQMLCELPQRLNDDFAISLDTTEWADNERTAECGCEEHSKELEHEVLVSKYNELLELATSSNAKSIDSLTEEDELEFSDEAHFPLPPYDEVSLCTDTEDIRLLQLLPGDFGDPIICNLFQIDSVTLYEYEAVSYVWGSTNNSRVIYVNDWEMAITENLEAALKALRCENEPRILWIDAICIDQSSITEKSSQVGKMGEIYKAAKKVLVFLGPESQASETVFDFLENGYSELPDLGHNTTEGVLSGLDASAYLIEHHLPLVKAFVELLFRPWFSRLWVRQEYIRAAEIPILYCGRRHLDFPEGAFNLLCEAVFLLPTLLKQPMSDVITTHQFHQVFSRAVSVFQTMNSANKYPERLDTWLNNEGISGCEASDPRDLIFSICALFDSVASTVLKADYSQSVEDVFLRASAWVLLIEQAPRILVEYPPLDREGVPSWVMDFAKARPTSRHHYFVPTFNANIVDVSDDEEDKAEAEAENNEENEGSKDGEGGEQQQEEEEEEEEEEEDEEADNEKADENNEEDGLQENHKQDDGGETLDDQDGQVNHESATRYEAVYSQQQHRHDDDVKADAVGSNEEPTPADVENAMTTRSESSVSEREHKAEVQKDATQLELYGEEDNHEGLEKQPQPEPTSEGQQDKPGNEPQEEPEEQPEEEDPEPPVIHCSLYQQTLSILGIELDIIEEIFELSSTNRIEAISKLWHLEKLFQMKKSAIANEDDTSGIDSLQKKSFILQWAVKQPVNHMISTLIPRSEHYLEYLDAELESFNVSLASELLEDLLGALIFDYPGFDSEMRAATKGMQTNESPSTDIVVHVSGMPLDGPRYEALRTELIVSDEERNERLLSHLRDLANRIIPSFLQQAEPPKSPRSNSFPASSSSSSDDDSPPTLHSLPRTHSDLIQAWENEREDIFSQLFQSCCFFRTKHRFPGLGAFSLKGLRKGDRVAILQGVPMPMLLRRNEGFDEETWKLVGPVVVRGIMDGEARGLVRDGELERKVFRIR